MSIAALQGLNLGALSAALAAAGSLKNAGVTGYGVPTVGNSGSTFEASPSENKPVDVYSVAAAAALAQERVQEQKQASAPAVAVNTNEVAPREARPTSVDRFLNDPDPANTLREAFNIDGAKIGVIDADQINNLLGISEVNAAPNTDVSLAGLGTGMDNGLAGNGVKLRSNEPMHSLA